MRIDLPYNFTYREYQKPQFVAASKGINRFYKVWHRRAGKDFSDFNFLIMKAVERVGLYWHMLPQYNQARKVIWQGMTKNGIKFLDCVPKELVKSVNNQEMKLEMVNGSIIQIVGSDNIDALVGTNPVGVIFSEYALTDPRAWPLIEPILLENGGWAVFNTTPRGHNHAYDLWELARVNNKWFTQMLTIKDTGVIPVEYIEELRKMGTPEEIIEQEYYCSFEGSLVGAYYAEQIKDAEQSGRITGVPYNPSFPVDVYYDIGMSDYTSMWFVQRVGLEFRLIDFLQNNGKGIDYYAKELKNRGYFYREHILPHDAGHRQFSTGKTIAEQMEGLVHGDITVLKRTSSVNADISAVRAFFKRCVFDKTKTADGINALKNYTKKWNDTKNAFDDKPLHDWSSHASDAFRYFAVHNADENDMAYAYDYKNLTQPDNNYKSEDDFNISDYI